MKRTLWIALAVCGTIGPAAAQPVIDETKLIRPQQLVPHPAAPAPTEVAQPVFYTIPAGTRILVRLTSPLHTTSATAGSGVYVETDAPVVVSDRVVVPAKTVVLGTVLHDRRPGRVRGRAQFLLHFDTLVLPNNHAVSIEGSLQTLPGSVQHRRRNERGLIEPVDQIDSDVYTVARSTIGLGILGGIVGRSYLGVGMGALTGGGLGMGKVLFSRGDEIYLPVGTRLEIVLDKPATVEGRWVQ